MNLPVVANSLELYLAEIARFSLLSREEEHELATRYRKYDDLEAAHTLISCNLRFVVKIAHEYRHYGMRFMDLIQEGNIGLMMAVKKFDPERGVKLISYAVSWIRAYMQNFIIRSWSMVKLGTTRLQRKLFYGMGRARSGEELDYDRMAESLGVATDELKEMKVRKEERDISLNQALTDGTGVTHLDLLADPRPDQEEDLGELEEGSRRKVQIGVALNGLSSRERFIVEKRSMAERPMTLQAIGEVFHISRERVRQIERSALMKLRRSLGEVLTTSH